MVPISASWGVPRDRWPRSACGEGGTAAESAGWGRLIALGHWSKPPIQLLRTKALPYLDAPLPLGPAMAAAVLGWGWRLLCGRIGCFYEVLSAGKKQTTRRGCACCREETPSLPAAGSIPPPHVRAASPGAPALAGSAARGPDAVPRGKSWLPVPCRDPEHEVMHSVLAGLCRRNHHPNHGSAQILPKPALACGRMDLALLRTSPSLDAPVHTPLPRGMGR